MITSNEPGVYVEGEFGIRHENEMVVVKGNKNFYGQFMHFETLTFVPFDRKGIDKSLLSEDELAWLNDYHASVYEKISPFLTNEEAEWLKDPILVKNLALIDTQIQNYIKNKLQKAKEKGFIEFTNLDVTAFLVYKMYIALIIEWSDKDKTMDEQMIANSISEVIKRGLRKE